MDKNRTEHTLLIPTNKRMFASSFSFLLLCFCSFIILGISCYSIISCVRLLEGIIRWNGFRLALFVVLPLTLIAVLFLRNASMFL